MFAAAMPNYQVPGVPPMDVQTRGQGAGMGSLGDWSTVIQELTSGFGKAGAQVVANRFGAPQLPQGGTYVRNADGSIRATNQSPTAFLDATLNTNAAGNNTTTLLLIGGVVVVGLVLLKGRR
jgi:hypothetical protein